MSLAAAKLRRGDRVVCAAFGTHTVEKVSQLPSGTLHVELSDAIELFADPTYQVTVLEAVA